MTKTPAFQSFHTYSGAHIFALPVEAFPNFWAYAYLAFAGETIVLIDTGSGNERSHASLEAGFELVGAVLRKPFNFTDITHILITHGHIDHFGGLVRLRELTNARAGIHELDVQTVTHHEERLAVMGRRLNAFLEQGGVEAGARGELLQMYRFTKAIYHSVPVDFSFEAAGMQVGPFEMIHVPGHCPGHVAIRLEDVVFCGDLVIEKVTPHQSPEDLTPFMGLRHYLESLSIFERWADGARLVLSGHDAPIPNLNERASDIRANLSHRLYQTLVGFAKPHTVADVCGQVYGQMGGYNSLLVLEKMGAYVEYLYQRGLLEISNLSELEGGGNPVIRYRCSHLVPEEELLPKERAYVFV